MQRYFSFHGIFIVLQEIAKRQSKLDDIAFVDDEEDELPSPPLAQVSYKTPVSYVGGNRSTVVARWTANQQVERSILHHGYDS